MMNRKRQTPSQSHQREGSSSGTKNEIIRPVTDDEPCTTVQPSLDLISAVKELHVLSPNDLGNLIRNAENGIIKLNRYNGTRFEINMESMAKNLGIHLIAKLLSFKRDEEHLKYLLCGIRLLHTLHILAQPGSKLNQFLLDDVRSGEQMFDLTFFMIVFISRSGQEYDVSRRMVLLHSALLACSLHLLTAFISPQWEVLTTILVSHHKVDIFTRAAFSGVLMVANILKEKLSAQHTDNRPKSIVDEVHCLFELSLASLQFLQLLCQQTLFRERLLTNNKEFCEEGGVLKLVPEIMKLPRCDDSELMDLVYQLKSKVLSTMLHLCEVECPSFLKMSSSTSPGLEIAKATVSEILDVLKMMFHGDLEDHPRGTLQLNAMRLIKIFSDDSGFRPYIILNLTEDLTQVFLQPEDTFLSTWCSCDDHPAEDIIMDFDSVSAAGHVLGVISTSFAQSSTLSTLQAPQILYANQISSLLVKIVANLSCSVRGLCKEGESLFAYEFLKCLKKEIPSDDAERTATATGNLYCLLALALSLAPKYVNTDDVQRIREFISQLEQLIAIQESEMQQVEEVPDRGKCSTSAPQRSSADEHDTRGKHKEDASVDLALVQLNEKRRKRSIMNDFQLAVIESALLHEPDLQRKAASIQHWADELSTHGSEVTASQLKNWLNNRRARLARAAANEARVSSGGDNTMTEKQDGSGAGPTPDPLEGPVDEHVDPSPSASQGTHQQDIEGQLLRISSPETKTLERGESITLIDEHGDKIGRGIIHLSRGVWFGKNLEESGLCVVDVTDLTVSKQLTLPYPSDTGSTFAEAEIIFGKMRILWNTRRILHRS